MDIARLQATLLRWRWVSLSVVLVIIAAAALHVVGTRAPYQARVMLQLTAPRDVDASVLDSGNASTSTLRDDLTLAQNDFTTVVGTAEVRRRTQQQLGLQGRDADYSVLVSPIGDSNFVAVLVSSPNAGLVQTIADAHVAQAIQFLGELRAKPANDTKQLLAAQLQAAHDKLPAATPQSGNQAAVTDAQDAQSTYAALLAKYTQASLIAQNAAQTSYIQIAAPAAKLTRPTLLHRLISLEELAVVGAVGLGVLLTLLLEQVFPQPTRAAVLPSPPTQATVPCAPTRRFVGVSRYHPTSRRNGLKPMALANPGRDAAGSE